MLSDNFIHLPFVYGLLRREIPHEVARYLRENSTFVDKGFILGQLYLIEDYPGAICTTTHQKVYGDIVGAKDSQTCQQTQAFLC